MARAIIHNSDYPSLAEAKQAIDRYFKERNEHFTKFPKRAGGNERRYKRCKPWRAPYLTPQFTGRDSAVERWGSR
jgi:hypothetical protein